MAAGWLTNLPSAVMMNYSLGVLSLMMALRRRSYAVLLYAGLAVALGAMLAGFFLLPAYHQKSWVNIGQVLAPGVRPQDGFLLPIPQIPITIDLTCWSQLWQCRSS